MMPDQFWPPRVLAVYKQSLLITAVMKCWKNLYRYSLWIYIWIKQTASFRCHAAHV